MESRCGILCSRCSWHKDKTCSGCCNIKEPFWGSCPVKNCCEEKRLEHCGECSDFPCTQLNEFAFAEQEGDCGVRLDQCKAWNASKQMRYGWIDEFLMAKQGSFMRQQYEDIIPGYYMNKDHWNSIKPDGRVEDDLLKDLLDKSYDLVLKSFSKKKQQEILEGGDKNDGI